ncbi:MAG: NADH-quinone oxidoreductase subunit C [Victivallaceae bacterium]|nr:NADH-quinone oxidoreductase subunit C [Victivallaceae bacterium]
MSGIFMTLKNGEAVPFSSCPLLSVEAFRDVLIDAVVSGGRRVSAFFALPDAEGEGGFRLVGVLANSASARFELASARVGGRYPALTPDCAAFHWFEREIAEQYGIVPEGHPWLKPIRFHRSWTGRDAWNRPSDQPIPPGVTDYFTMTGEAAHEVAVGPVHAGVIEPGHFRFECMGEDVHSLEISLGYQHRGIEPMLIGGPDRRTLHFMETAAGDTTVASAIAHARVIEALAGISLPDGNALLQGVALELERIANHTGDLGALAGDVAFLPTASFCGRIRGEYLNMTAELCGNRFGRGIVVPGGTGVALEPERAAKLVAWIERVYPELRAALDMMLNSPTVLDRFEGTGTVDRDTTAAIGAVGVAARAGGLAIDVRHDFPGREHGGRPPVMAGTGAGDVVSRARVRYREIVASHDWLLETLRAVAAAVPSAGTGEAGLNLRADSIAVAAAEGWRGELCHVAITGGNGKFRRYKIVDPSFHNWFALALALRGEQISNFPICNKSFSLSYCGHDL